MPIAGARRGIGVALGDNTVAAALLDRLLHRSVVIDLTGDSYCLRDHHARTANLRRNAPAVTPGPVTKWPISLSKAREFR